MNEMMPFHLSKSEFKVMTVLWDSKEPLTSGEIVEKIATSKRKTFQDRSIYCILNGLLDDGLVKCIGTKRRGKSNARQFQAVLSRSEWCVRGIKRLLDKSEIDDLCSKLKGR